VNSVSPGGGGVLLSVTVSFDSVGKSQVSVEVVSSESESEVFKVNSGFKVGE